VFSVAQKIAYLVSRRSALIVGLTVIAALVGCVYGLPPGHGPVGLWDGPL